MCKEVKVWVRVGMDISMPMETLVRVLQGTGGDELLELIKQGDHDVTGDTYIPKQVIETLRSEHPELVSALLDGCHDVDYLF